MLVLHQSIDMSFHSSLMRVMLLFLVNLKKKEDAVRKATKRTNEGWSTEEIHLYFDIYALEPFKR